MKELKISDFLLWRGDPSSFRVRVLIVIAPGVVGLMVLLCLSPIVLNPAYHLFTDSRAFLGIPHFFNVVTKLVFILVGLYGLAFMICWRLKVSLSGILNAWSVSIGSTPSSFQ